MQIRKLLLVTLLFTFGALVQDARAAACSDRTSENAMWWSILHPGVGEWYLKGFGPLSNAPPRKFWLGFIPGYGWPGYLQVKSAIDSHKCKTNDSLTFE